MLEHLRNQIGDKDTSDMTPEELQFYYFKQHDYDNNNMLDGIELIQGNSTFGSCGLLGDRKFLLKTLKSGNNF